MRNLLIIIITTLLSISYSFADEVTYKEQTWGMGAVVRGASIAFDTEADKVSSFVPLMFYQGETFFMRGTEGGAHLYKEESNQFNVIGRMRFFDIPAEYQNQIQGDQVDIGMQWRTNLYQGAQLDFEVFSDLDGRFYSNVTSNWYFEEGDWEFMPSLTARYKSADFNSHYFGLEQVTNERIGAGVEVNANVEARYHVHSNLYLIGSLGVTGLDKNAYESSAINQRWNSEAYLGFAFFNDKTKAKKESLKTKSYYRIAHGWATPSNMGDIFRGDTVKDEYNNQLSSIFYGLPLTDELFSLPVDIYLTPGFVWHWSSEVQSSEQEYVLGIKAYVTVPWPVRWRIGVAEGLSYVSDLTYIEATEMEEKGYQGSELLNYIDVSFDVNIGDIFNANSLDNIWLGYSLHHRSAIFESASQFGRIKGGSNYNSVYIQVDF